MSVRQRAARYALVLVVFLAFEVWQHQGVPPRGLLVAMLIGGAVGITLIESGDALLRRHQRRQRQRG